MKYRVLAVAAVFLLPAFAGTQQDDSTHSHQKQASEAASSNEAPIKITINPEARVSVKLAGALPPPVPCGTAMDLAVEIINQGFVTATLEAELVDPPSDVTLDFHPAALKGVPEERRTLRITLIKRGPTDVTISFHAHNDVPDLGGRDRIHFLLRCK